MTRGRTDKTPDAMESAISWGPIVVQTDTVYCLAAPCDSDFADELYEIKGRVKQETRPDKKSPYLPVVVGEQAQLTGLGLRVEGAARAFAEAFWPGALTLVMGFAEGLDRPRWLSGRAEVAVRIPAFEPLQALAARLGPLLVTSANRTGDPPATSRSEAASIFGDRYPIFDWPKLASIGIHTTILNTRREPPIIERPGAVSPLEIMTVYERYLGGAEP